MFNNASLFSTDDKETYNVKKLKVNHEVQDEITNTFSNAYSYLMNNKNYLQFDGRYKAEKDEVQYIENFNMPDSIINSIKEPLSIDDLNQKSSEARINSIFTGEEKGENGVTIAFQNFQKGQVITNKGVNLILNNDTFHKIDSLALNIKNEVDCVYENNNLYFSSFWKARQIFDLSGYYNEATDEDISRFANRSELYVPDKSEFENNADDWVRRKVALIQDAGILDKYHPKEIVKRAKAHKVTLKTEGDQLVVPHKKKELKTMLKFLDEDIYRGPLTDDTFETNSKRQLHT